MTFTPFSCFKLMVSKNGKSEKHLTLELEKDAKNSTVLWTRYLNFFSNNSITPLLIVYNINLAEAIPLIK